MSKKRKSGASSGDREILEVFVAFMSLNIGYFLAEGLLARFVQPVHWITAVVAGLLGYTVTVLIYSQLPKSRKP